MTERHQRNLVTAQAEQDITRLFRPLSRAVGRSLRRHGAQYGMTALTYQLVMRDVDRALDAVFGRYRGDDALPVGWKRGDPLPLLPLVISKCRQSRAWVWGRHAAMARSRLRGQGRLLEMIEGESA